MPVIAPALPADGDSAVVEPYNAAITAILGLINGALDDSNITSVNGSKVVAGTLPITALSPAALQGWIPITQTPNSITNNGAHSYNAVWNSIDLTPTVDVGQRIQIKRAVATPAQCATFNGSSQYFNNISPTNITFTNNFTISAWVKLSSYQTGSILSRFNGTSGWAFGVTANGNLFVQAYNAGAGNYRLMQSYMSIPLNRWVKVSAEMDMSGFTTATCGMQIDDINVPVSLASAGTNPTSLLQAGNLELGSTNGGTVLFAGEIAQVELFNALISASTLATYSGQALAGSETNAIAAYSLSNSVLDLTSSGNTLTANGGVATTTADAPFAFGVSTGLYEYGIITAKSVAGDNTTMVIQTCAGCVLPSSSGVTANSYSPIKKPYGFPTSKHAWTLIYKWENSTGIAVGGAAGTWQPLVGTDCRAPVGQWEVDHNWIITGQITGAAAQAFAIQIASAVPVVGDITDSIQNYVWKESTASVFLLSNPKGICQLPPLAAATTFKLYGIHTLGTSVNIYMERSPGTITFENGYL